MTVFGVSCSVLSVAWRLDSLGVPATASQADTRRALEMAYRDQGSYWPPRWLVEQTVDYRTPTPSHQVDPSGWPACVLCRKPMNPAGLRPHDITHPACDLPPFACDCETPWDGAARPGGVHCVYCHHDFGGAEVFEAHQPYRRDGCTSLANLPDVDGAQQFALYREGRFKIWRRLPRTVAPKVSSGHLGGRRSA